MYLLTFAHRYYIDVYVGTIDNTPPSKTTPFKCNTTFCEYGAEFVYKNRIEHGRAKAIKTNIINNALLHTHYYYCCTQFK